LTATRRKTALKWGVEQSTEQPIQRVYRARLHVWQNVAVAVERHGNCCVTQHLAHDLGMAALTEKQCRAGMPQVMEADPRQAGLLNCLMIAGKARSEMWLPHSAPPIFRRQRWAKSPERRTLKRSRGVSAGAVGAMSSAIMVVSTSLTGKDI